MGLEASGREIWESEIINCLDMKTEVLEHLSSKVKIKLGLKQTEIGSLPEDWVVVELGNLIAKNLDYGINELDVDFNFNLPNY